MLCPYHGHSWLQCRGRIATQFSIESTQAPRAEVAKHLPVPQIGVRQALRAQVEGHHISPEGVMSMTTAQGGQQQVPGGLPSQLQKQIPPVPQSVDRLDDCSRQMLKEGLPVTLRGLAKGVAHRPTVLMRKIAPSTQNFAAYSRRCSS